MTAQRKGEADSSNVSRRNRLYSTSRGWFFNSREGIQFGPFAQRADAECALAVYIAQHLDHYPQINGLRDEYPGTQDGVDHMVQEVVDVLDQYRDFGPVAASNWIKCRLDDLKTNAVDSAETTGRILALEFSANHPDQTFDFEEFLLERAASAGA